MYSSIKLTNCYILYNDYPFIVCYELTSQICFFSNALASLATDSFVQSFVQFSMCYSLSLWDNYIILPRSVSLVNYLFLANRFLSRVLRKNIY